MHIAHEHGLVFNGEKCEVKLGSVTFCGTVYDADGTHPGPRGRCSPPDAITRDPITTATLFWNGHLSLLIHPITLYTHCTTTGTAEKGFSEFTWNTSY